MKKPASGILKLLSVAALTSMLCGSASATLFNFTATLSPANEIPPTGTGASGSGTFVFDDVLNQISGTVNFAGLSANATLSHIHLGGPTQNNIVIVSFVPFTPSATSGTIIGNNLTFPTANIAALFAGNTYFNIHDNNFPGGEERGQLILVPEPGTLSLAGLGLLGMWFANRRKKNA